MNSIFVGNFKASFYGKGVEFQDFREYGPNDDAKHIDWMASSREWNTIMRRYREEKGTEILAVVDINTSNVSDEIKTNLMRDCLELLYHGARNCSAAFGGYVSQGDRFKFITWEKTKTSLLQLLKLSSKPRDYSQSLHLDMLHSKILKRSIVFILSDSIDIDLKSLKIAALKHDLIYIHISTNFENTLEWSGVHELREAGESFAIDLDDTEKRQQYVTLRNKELTDFKISLSRAWADWIFLDEKKSLFTEFITFMKNRERKK